MAKIKVTLVKSTIGEVAAVKGTVAALGLKKSVLAENSKTRPQSAECSRR